MKRHRSCQRGPSHASCGKRRGHWMFVQMSRRNSTRTWLLLVLRFVVCLSFVVVVMVEAKPRKVPPEKMIAEKRQPDEGDDIPGVPFLVELLGKELYSLINRPRYRFYLYMTVGKLPDEHSFVAILNVLCNCLYCISILVGFLLLPRNYMLIGTLVTLVVGPALILLLVGTMGLLAVVFGLYPIPSVISLWLIFFLTSQLFQVLGRRLGLDTDGDGNVDFLDLLHSLAQTSWGRWIGLPKLHEALHQATMNPLTEIKQQLDEILNRTLEGTESVRALVKESSASTTTTTTNNNNNKNGDGNKKIN